jgi:hypothetical protein
MIPSLKEVVFPDERDTVMRLSSSGTDSFKEEQGTCRIRRRTRNAYFSGW